MDDDADWPIGLSRHGMEAERFRRWRRQHPGQPSSEYDAGRDERRSDPTPLEPLTPAQQGQAWKADHDDGYLTDHEAANLAIGIAPPLTFGRVARAAPLVIGFSMAVVALFALFFGVDIASWPAAVGVGGFLLVFFTLIVRGAMSGGRQRFRPPKRRPRR